MKPTNVFLLLLLAAGCGTVDHGRVNMHGTTPGNDASIAPNACQFSGVFSGVISGKRGVAFTSSDGPAAVTINDDGSGARLQIARMVDGSPTLREFDHSQCTSLAYQLQPTGWVINGQPLFGIDAQIECTSSDGVNVVGSVHFPRCGTSSEAQRVLNAFQKATPQGAPPAADAAETARLAALFHVPPHSDVPSLPAPLSGMKFRVQARIAGATVGNETLGAAEQACTAGLEQMLTAAGWIAVHAPGAPADLDVLGYCTGHVSWSAHGNLIEINYPVSNQPGMVIQHAGTVLATVPTGPSDFVCEGGGAPAQAFADCAARAQEWAKSRILAAIAASQPLAQLAQQLKGR